MLADIQENSVIFNKKSIERFMSIHTLNYIDSTNSYIASKDCEDLALGLTLKSNFDWILGHSNSDSPPLSGRSWTPLKFQDGVLGNNDMKKINDMMIFIAENLSSVALLKLSPNEDDTVAKFLSKNYWALSKAASKIQKSLPSETKDPQDLDLFREMHKPITLAAGLVAGSTINFHKLFGSCLDYSLILDKLPSTEIHDLIKEIIYLRKDEGRPYIENIFKKDRHITFIGACLKLKNQSSQILRTLYEILREAQNLPNRHSPPLLDFFLLILKNEVFAEIHPDAAAFILQKRNWYELERDFECRSNSAAAKEAIGWLCQRICVIKQKTISDENKKQELLECLGAFDRNLFYFQPFQKIINFALVYYDQKMDENMPGLPFKMIGRSEIDNFIVEALLQLNFEEANFFDPSVRKKLLKCAEPMIQFNFADALQHPHRSNIDHEKLETWLKLFPEVEELSCWNDIKKFCLNSSKKKLSCKTRLCTFKKFIITSPLMSERDD